MLSQSKDMSHEYCCTIVRLGQILPIEGANTVAKTLVNGREIVIGKNCKEGDIMCYVSNECQLNTDFMYINNLYENYLLNSNVNEVSQWLEQNIDASPDEIKEYKRQHTGYFDKNARVRMKKLCGTISMGFLFEPQLLINWCPKLKDFNFASLINSDFDTVNGELFVQAYVPPIKETPIKLTKEQQILKHISKYNRLIPGQFAFHYDTQQLERNITRLNPDDVIAISVKLHGTSCIIGNVLTKKPKWNGLYSKIFVYLPKFLQFTRNDYDVIYASRTVIKNQYINPKVTSGFYKKDVWNSYYEILKNFLYKGVTIYGEIIGYVDESNSMIQKGFDYKCNPGTNKLMIYRVTYEHNGKREELDISDVKDFTELLIRNLKSAGLETAAEKIHPIDILYHGKARDLYDIPVDENWHSNLLEHMKQDVDRFGMEQKEPLCRNKVPREGICLRIDSDPVNECFKLKCLSFLNAEAKLIDKGETSDVEMVQKYG